MTVTYTKFMNSVKTALLLKLATTSVDTYLSKLIILHDKRAFSSLVFLKNVKSIRSFIDKFENLKTQRSYYAAIVSVLTHIKMDESKSYKATAISYRGLLTDIINKINEEPTGIKSDKQMKNFMEWSEIETVLSVLSKKVKHFTKEDIDASMLKRRLLSQHLLLAVYVLQPPRRSSDYLLLKVGENNDDGFNWYDGKKLFFNNYKTAKTYGAISYDVPKNVKAVLDNFIELYDLNEGDYIIQNEDRKAFANSSAITKALNRIFSPKKVSTTMLRHIYLTSKYGEVKAEQIADAEAMGHSLSMQRDYVVRDPD